MHEAIADKRLLENLLQGGVQVHWSIENGWGADFTKIHKNSRLLHHFGGHWWLASNLHLGIRHFGSVLQYFLIKYEFRVLALRGEKRKGRNRGSTSRP